MNWWEYSRSLVGRGWHNYCWVGFQEAWPAASYDAERFWVRTRSLDKEKRIVSRLKGWRCDDLHGMAAATGAGVGGGNIRRSGYVLRMNGWGVSIRVLSSE